MDDLSVVEAVDRFRGCRKVADAADGRLDPGFGEPLGVFDRNILGAAIAMMNEAAAAGRPSVMKRLFQSVQDKVRGGCPAGPPTDDPPGVGVDDEGDIDEAGPGRDIGEIREPQTVWSGSAELAVHVIQRTESRFVADRCPQRFARIAPRRPIFRISRATVQRATLKPSRRNCRQTLRTP